MTEADLIARVEAAWPLESEPPRFPISDLIEDVVLLAATAVSVYKPVGLTPHGQRMQREGLSVGASSEVARIKPFWSRIAAFILLALIVWVIIKHLTGGGHSHH